MSSPLQGAPIRHGRSQPRPAHLAPTTPGSPNTYNHIGAVLRERRFVGLAELNGAIFDLVDEINARPFQKREDSRQIVFERDEKPLLNPLPAVRFELADLRKGKVAPNYHLQIDRNFYSVPARLLGQSLVLPATLGEHVEGWSGRAS